MQCVRAKFEGFMLRVPGCSGCIVEDPNTEIAVFNVSEVHIGGAVVK